MLLPEQSFLSLERNGCVIVAIHVVPNAAKTQIQGLHDGALRVRLNAPPVDGKANLELHAWLARVLGIARADVELIRGEVSRRKQFRVAAGAVSRADWARLLPPAQVPGGGG